ncbi:MAG: Zn-ribbon domain-containing OB-fold protein [Cupriavidus necator]
MYPVDLENAPPAMLRQPVLYADINYDVGETNGRFFATLRDHGRITATRCAACERVYLPPRISCHDCFAELHEWVDVSDVGTLVSYTIVREPGMLQPVARPYVLGLIQLDGADTALAHYLGEVDPADVKTGMRVHAVLAEERMGNIWDIRYFKPVGDGA